MKKYFLIAVFGVTMFGAIEQAWAVTINLDAGPDNWSIRSTDVVVSRTSPSNILTPSMWVCSQVEAEAGACGDATKGPDTAQFLNSFFFSSHTKHVNGDFHIIADDLVEVAFNNRFIFAANFEENGGIPLEFSISDDINHNINLNLISGKMVSQGDFDKVLSINGVNSIKIFGFDGYFADDPRKPASCSEIRNIPNSSRQWCVTNRLNSYVYVTGAIETTVPEPSTIILLAIGLSGLTVLRRLSA